MTHAAFAIAYAYLLGCFNTGYYLVCLKTGQDIRTLASGGTGSRNVGRLLGTKGFVLTLVGAAGKGMAAIWLGPISGIGAVAALCRAAGGYGWPHLAGAARFSGRCSDRGYLPADADGAYGAWRERSGQTQRESIRLTF